VKEGNTKKTVKQVNWDQNENSDVSYL